METPARCPGKVMKAAHRFTCLFNNPPNKSVRILEKFREWMCILFQDGSTSSGRERRAHQLGPVHIDPTELDFDMVGKDDALQMETTQDSTSQAQPVSSGADNAMPSEPASDAPAVDGLKGSRITSDMSAEDKDKIMEARRERKRKHSREWRSKYASKGVPALSVVFGFTIQPTKYMC